MFYVYAYIRERTSSTANAGTPYYIGKGCDRRAYTKHKNVNRPISKNIIILESNMTEIGAFALERRLIKWWGRKDLKTGILHNMTDGGEGGSGRKHSAESISKMMKPKTDSHRKRMMKPKTDSHRHNMSKAKLGKHRTEEQIKNKRKSYIFLDSNDQIHAVNNLKKFCYDNALTYSCMAAIGSGTYLKNEYKGWKLFNSHQQIY